MNELTKFLVDGILNEDQKQTIALFGGGFKPPTKGHLDVIINGLRQNPEINKVKIIVGGGKRGDFNQIQSAKIWEIYRNANLIPVDVEIIKASPFKYYKDYLTQNPNDKVFVFIGSREGDEDDQFDVKERSEYVKKYSDNVIPVEVATTGGISGTEARDLFQNNIKSFRNMFPDNLSDDEYNQILKILGKKDIKEGRKKKKDPKKGTGKKPKDSNRRLYTDEDPKDTVGIKFSTKQDIVDTLNKTSFKSKSHARQSQIINLIHQRVRAAYGRAKDPAVKKRLKTGLDYITKKKEASKKKTQRLKNKKLNENSTYSNKIDYKQQILDLTKHMIKKGMNILPLPKVIFKHGDQENASQFLGKTAYYNPSDMVIVLYTEGRHPKDIARSFSHEMIHHIQNLENRLGGINTTNTMEDDNLNDIEREAYTKGNMTFRNWTDNKDGEEVTSLNENLLLEAINNDIQLLEEGLADLLQKGIQLSTDFINKKVKPIVDKVLKGIISGAKWVYGLLQKLMDLIGRFREKYPVLSKIILVLIILAAMALFNNVAAQDPGTMSYDKNSLDAMVGILNKSQEMGKLADVSNFDVMQAKVYLKDLQDGNLASSVDYTDVVKNLASTAESIFSSIMKDTKSTDPTLSKPAISSLLDYLQSGKNTIMSRMGQIVNEAIVGEKIECDNCGWSWNIVDGGDDLFICHKCGYDNTPLNEAKPYKHKFGFSDKLGKDPFGLNQYARELVGEAFDEDQEPFVVYCDMDGVLCDFELQFKELTNGISAKEYKAKNGVNGFWKIITDQGEKFWSEMPWTPEGKKLWSYIKKYNPILLSAPSNDPSSRLGKRQWVEKNLPGVTLKLASRFNKPDYATNDNTVLIDDYYGTIVNWKDKGSIGIWYNNYSSAITQLQKAGL